MKKNKENSIKDEKEDEKKSDLGIFLKEERERRGYSIDEIANIIKIRKKYIDAIESEDWEKFPSPVFIKGFLRSYAKALEIDIKKVLDIYKSNNALREEIPRPLVEPEKSKKKFVLVILILLCLLIYTLYLWLNSQQTVVDSKQTRGAEDVNEVVLNEGNSLDVNKQEIITEGVKEADPVRVEKPKFEEADEYAQATGVIGIDEKIDEYSVIPDVLELKESVSVSQNKDITEKNDYTPQLNETIHRLLLRGIVKMKTYVKIYIDDNPPKEYIFEPGSRPQWEAQKGFDILVGNAAGIEFDFNGELKKNLGEAGKVVRIRFPEDFKAGFYE